jgi:CTP:molybdopterin cytidylyltransferase MocA
MGNNTVFILLAGGKSERMGVAKGLLKFKHSFWILEQLNRISTSEISKVYIGLGYNYQHYFDAIPWFKSALNNSVNFKGLEVKTVINPTPKLGSFSTLQAVLKEIDSSNAVIINPIDTPLLNPSELNKIILTKNNIVISTFKGKNGHPIKIDYNFWRQLLSLNVMNKEARLDVQIKNISPSKISYIEVFDNAILKNLNTKKDWISFLKEDS